MGKGWFSWYLHQVAALKVRGEGMGERGRVGRAGMRPGRYHTLNGRTSVVKRVGGLAGGSRGGGIDATKSCPNKRRKER